MEDKQSFPKSFDTNELGRARSGRNVSRLFTVVYVDYVDS